MQRFTVTLYEIDNLIPFTDYRMTVRACTSAGNYLMVASSLVFFSVYNLIGETLQEAGHADGSSNRYLE